MQVEPPESALERALLDREEAVGRLERELNKERTSAQARTSTMQRRLEEALKKVAAAAKDNESHCLAIDAARRAHEADLQDASKREKRLQSELANTQVLSLLSLSLWRARSSLRSIFTRWGCLDRFDLVGFDVDLVCLMAV